MKKFIAIILTATIFLNVVSCGWQRAEKVMSEEPVYGLVRLTPDPTIAPTAAPTPSPVPTENLAGKAINPLTGLYIGEEKAKMRPMAVVINNIKRALPQSGISQADILYEILSEGDITRIIAIFQDFDSNKIGPVRSTRHYFLNFAFDNDAIFVHHGGSQLGYDAMRSSSIDNLDGMALDGRAFQRDQTRINQPGMFEHSSYTGYEMLSKVVDDFGLRKTREAGETTMFKFFDKPTSPEESEKATKVTVPFSNAYTSIFEYDEETSLYSKFQNENKHIDEETGEQLKFANVIIQFTSMHVISGDDAGRREVNLVSSGSGYLATNGVYTPIRWEKKSLKSPTAWYFEDGQPLHLNKGKTWVGVYNGNVKFEPEQEIEEEQQDQ